jgi:hypothetical protein
VKALLLDVVSTADAHQKANTVSEEGAYVCASNSDQLTSERRRPKNIPPQAEATSISAMLGSVDGRITRCKRHVLR